MPEKTVLILGGSLAGLQITHRLLKHTLPHEPDLKVILVSKVSALLLPDTISCQFAPA